MPDYKRMYALLCGAIDKVIDPLEQIPAAEHMNISLILRGANRTRLRSLPV